MLAEVNANLIERGVTMRSGTIVDATIMAAPSSMKNARGKRYPGMVSGDESELRTTKKGNQWYFVRWRASLARLGTATAWRPAPPQEAAGGAKAHIGVDAATGLVHSVKLTAANVADVTVAHELIRSEDEVVHADAGYQGLAQRESLKQAQQEGRLQPALICEVVLRPGKRRALTQRGELGTTLARIEQFKAKICAKVDRAKVEHAFQWLKQRCGLRKLRYRGLWVQCQGHLCLGQSDACPQSVARS